MDENNSKSIDLLGIKGASDSIKIVTQAGVDGAAAFLGRICLPATEEFGFLLRDKVKNWRKNNTIKMLQEAEAKYNKYNKSIKLRAHPRLALKVLEQSSWVDDDIVLGMWSGLLASSCSEDGKDESNIVFTSILSQITSLQASVVNYGCDGSNIRKSKAGWIVTKNRVIVGLKKLQEITHCSDSQRLDRELDHLRALGLLKVGFDPDSKKAEITPRSLALQLYVRCQGYTGSPIDYFGLEKS